MSLGIWPGQKTGLLECCTPNSVAHCISGDAGDTEEEIGSVGITMAQQLEPTCCGTLSGAREQTSIYHTGYRDR